MLASCCNAHIDPSSMVIYADLLIYLSLTDMTLVRRVSSELLTGAHVKLAVTSSSYRVAVKIVFHSPSVQVCGSRVTAAIKRNWILTAYKSPVEEAETIHTRLLIV